MTIIRSRGVPPKPKMNADDVEAAIKEAFYIVHALYFSGGRGAEMEALKYARGVMMGLKLANQVEESAVRIVSSNSNPTVMDFYFRIDDLSHELELPLV